MNMKKILCLKVIFSLLFSSTVAFAQSTKSEVIQSAVSQYDEKVFVLGEEQPEALRELFIQLKKNGVQTQDILDYVATHADAHEQNSMIDMSQIAQEEMRQIDQLNKDDVQYIFSEMMKANQSTGAHYQGCEGQAVLGGMMIFGAVLLALESFEKFDDYDDSRSTFGGRDSSLRDEAFLYGFFAVVAGGVGGSLISSCNR